MTQLSQKEFSPKTLQKLLKKSIKKVVAEKGISPTTRKGNRELELLVKKIAKQPFNSLEQARRIGEKLGEKIVEISQQRGKENLDKGVIRQLAIQGEMLFISELSTEESQPSSQVSEKPSPEEDSTSIDVPQPTEASQPSSLVSDESSPEEDSALIDVPKSTEKSQPISQPSDGSSSKEDLVSISLKERLTEDIKSAMKAKDKIRLETVRSVKKALLEKEIAVRPKGQESLTEEQEIELLAQQAKQRRESIEQYRQAGRDDLADKETQELAIIETYLPEQLSDGELSAILDEIIATVGATSPKDMGKVMAPAMQQLKGRADGKKIQALVKSKLGS